MQLRDTARILHGDCLKLIKDIPDGSVDLVLTDPPYGTMKGFNDKFEWDTTLPTAEMFKEISRVLRRNGKCVLFSQEPYTSHLITNVPASLIFCYRGVWDKGSSGNCKMAKTAMVNCYEDFLVFTNKNTGGELTTCTRDIQNLVDRIGFDNFAEIMMGEGRYKDLASAKNNLRKKIPMPGRIDYDNNFFDENMYRYLETQIEMPYTFDEYFSIVSDYKAKTQSVFNLWEGSKSKSNVLRYKRDPLRLHPTQKPVALLEDLIRTYSNLDDTVLDFTMGVGSTGVAALRTGRRFIGIELQDVYFTAAKKRISTVAV